MNAYHRDGPRMDPGGGPGARERRAGTPAKHRLYAALGTTAGLAALAGGALALLPSHPREATPASTVADSCGLVNCGATLPSAVASPTTPAPKPSHARPGSSRAPVTMAPATPAATTPSATTPSVTTPSPTPSSAAPANVTVSYAAQQWGYHGWGESYYQDGFQGQLTIINHGSATVSGWRLALDLPGDQVQWVGFPGGPTGGGTAFANWQVSGSTVILDAAAGSEAIAPGQTVTLFVAGHGSPAAPASCTFDRAACHS